MVVPMIDEVTIAPRFNGPPTSANGGYTCGLVASAIGPGARVSLLAPPPVGVALARHRLADGSVRLLHGDRTVAEGHPAHPSVDVPAPPTFDAATRAARDFAAQHAKQHVYPTCFVCGPQREADGLRLFPGPVGEDGVLACPWRPTGDLITDGVIDRVFVWAALDCPSGLACIPLGRRTVLASMTAAVKEPVYPGQPYTVTAWPIASEGRKHRAGSSIHDASGALVAVAEALWITLRDQGLAGEGRAGVLPAGTDGAKRPNGLG
jgi:hypothetical protein